MDGTLLPLTGPAVPLRIAAPAPTLSPELPSDPDAGGAALAHSRRLVAALQRPSCYAHPCDAVEVVETHLSWVLLTGPFAYKIKKPVNLGFADFSTLARRQHYCEQELRLNRRLAPQVYRDVVAITGSIESPRIDGGGPVLDYAVRMVQFPQERLAARRLRDGRLEPRHIDGLAADLAAFHARVPWAGAAMRRGEPDALQGAARDNFAALQSCPGLGCEAALEVLAQWTESRFAESADALRRRRDVGCVRECHGDLHLGNMALIDDRLVMFDCIEFNSQLRWVDTAGEVAFVMMDLLQRDAAGLAQRFLNAYLEATGDYRILPVLDYFLVYRALVRAKVAALRAAQCEAAGREAALAEARSYVTLARRLTRRRPPVLAITHGLSGSGKTRLTQALVDELGFIRIRSDVERKRLFGLGATARTAAGLGQGIYAAGATERTYAALEERAAAIVESGFSVVVDATFLKAAQRQRFAALARRLGCRLRIVALAAPIDVLRDRVARRLKAAGEASEATQAVLDAQLRACEAPAGDELKEVLALDSTAPDAASRVVHSLTGDPNGSATRSTAGRW